MNVSRDLRIVQGDELSRAYRKIQGSERARTVWQTLSRGASVKTIGSLANEAYSVCIPCEVYTRNVVVFISADLRC